jgi:hypothetical protein
LPVTPGRDVTVTPDSIADPVTKKALTVYFIRHAETMANVSGQHGGEGCLEDHDILTELGEKQVEDFKNFLIKENIRPDLFAVSPSLRTQKTIEPFLKALGIKAEIWVELNECCDDDPYALSMFYPCTGFFSDAPSFKVGVPYFTVLQSFARFLLPFFKIY